MAKQKDVFCISFPMEKMSCFNFQKNYHIINKFVLDFYTSALYNILGIDKSVYLLYNVPWLLAENKNC